MSELRTDLTDGIATGADPGVDRAATDGDVVVLLRAQHQDIRRLLHDVVNAPRDERAAHFEPLVRLLAVHETAEEEVVYPALRGTSGTADDAVQARRSEEDQAKKHLAHLESLDPASDEFELRLLEFRTVVELHAESEEEDVFPLLAATHSAADLRRLGDAVRAAEALAPTHAHRLAPESAIGNLLVGPFVAMIDRVRDAIRDAATTGRDAMGDDTKH